MPKRTLIVALGLIVSVPAANAASPEVTDTPSKNHYWLFNPTPRAEMRELSTDRPDKTESPYTVDAGHFQFETDLVNAAIDKNEEGTITRTFAFNLINLKVGVANFSDLQLILGANYRVETRGGAADAHHWSFSDITVRWKFNIFGNDAGDVAFGVMPFVKIPTAMNPIGNGITEGGLIFPFALNGPWGLGFGTMAQVNFKVDPAATATYYPVFISSLTAGRDIGAGFAAYVEIYSESSIVPNSAWISTFDTGITWEFVKNWQLDVGVNIGLTPAADDWNPFLGLSGRI